MMEEIIIEYALFEIGPEGMTPAKHQEMLRYAGATIIKMIDNPITHGKTLVLLREKG